MKLASPEPSVVSDPVTPVVGPLMTAKSTTTPPTGCAPVLVTVAVRVWSVPTRLEALVGVRVILSSLPPWVGLKELLSIRLAKATGDPCPVVTTVAVNPSTKTITGTIPKKTYRLAPVGLNI